MKKLIVIVLLFSSVTFVKAQSSNDVLISSGLDLLKTDNKGIFKKAQLGVEAHYFIIRHFAVGGGVEIWSAQKSSFMMGMRWYANDNLFLRFRGLIGANTASLGAGYTRPINKYWRGELLGDLYFPSGGASTAAGIRIGVGYVIH